MELARASRKNAEIPRSASSYEYTVTVGQPDSAKRGIFFSPKEVKHLVAGSFMVMSVGLSSMLFFSVDSLQTALTVFGVYGIVLTISFLAHELAHKFSAQKIGLWAEFRLSLWGTLITLLSVISPVFKIISPGAVMVSGSEGPKEMGKISLAGPLTNIFFSAALAGFALIPSSYSGVLVSAAFIKGFMGLFNLIPFGILDGFKVFQWDKRIWGTAFAASTALTITSYYLF
jgi:Zn-dependent protease